MNQVLPRPQRVALCCLASICLLFVGSSVVGISWGLPSRSIDPYLFGGDPAWSGGKIYRLAGALEKFASDRGADVDMDPLARPTEGPIPLTATEADIARIYLRYRLYTYQPDEMITMMALRSMRPGKLDFDPRLYQYGGLFLYPVGALIKLSGLIDVRNDLVYYLDHPDEFGKFYIVARAYAAAWGLLGVVMVFLITRRLSGLRGAVVAALLFTLMPVVVCMAHEGKPHLPGAVLMLLAVYFAMRHLTLPATTEVAAGSETSQWRKHDRNWWLMCICCGAALGMVLSSGPIFVLIPMVAWMELRSTRKGRPEIEPNVAHQNEADQHGIHLHMAHRTWRGALKRTFVGLGVAVAVYLIANPYVPINALFHREVLASNFGNSLAMYEVSRVGEGFLRVVELTTEGATWPIVWIGVAALVVALVRKNGAIWPLAAPAGLFFAQFVMIGAGKPAEYGRFGIFPDTALAIAAACLLGRRWTRLREIVNWIPVVLVTACVAFPGALYLFHFHLDTTARGSRRELAAYIRRGFPAGATVALLAEPAPYDCPPLNFAKDNVFLLGSRDGFQERAPFKQYERTPGMFLLTTVDRRNWRMGSRGDLKALHSRDLLQRLSPNVRFFPGKRYFYRGVPGLSRAWWFVSETPISWANKTFAVTSENTTRGYIKDTQRHPPPRSQR